MPSEILQAAFLAAVVTWAGCSSPSTPESEARDTGAVSDAATEDLGATSKDAGPSADLGVREDAGAPDLGVPAVCGDGEVSGDEECDDGNGQDGDECSSACTRSYACSALPIDCASAQPPTTEHFLVPAEPCGFALTPPSATALTEQRALIAALADESGGVVSVEDVLGDLNRSGTAGIGVTNADRLTNHDFRGFRWNSGDAAVDYWYPQGVTGSSDAYEDGKLAGRDVMMVSWYHNSEDRPTKGVRISIADTTNLASVTYRHVLLVEPTGTPDAPSFRSAQTGSGGALHAGGIVWWGDLLYVADTTGGFRVYDLANMMRTKNTDDTDRIGVEGARFDGLGYAYVVPELMRFRRNGDGCTVRFSFVGLDRSSNPPALISGEYRADDIGGRLVTWDIDPLTGWLDVRSGEVRASSAFVSGQTRMQGGVRYEGNFYISSSSQFQRFGRLYRTREGFGESSITAWVYGAEDLYMQRDADVIWTAAEFPGDRDVVGIPLVRP